MNRLRIFAGPNGSGKSTLIDILPNKWLGVYVNPDEIEKKIRKYNYLNFNDYNITSDENGILEHIKQNQSFYQIDISMVTINENKIFFESDINSYIASILASYIRKELFLQNISFSFETVMSSKDKIEFLQKAKVQGFKIYLYFIATEDPEININRVKNRVQNGGHNVPKGKIISRYYKTLDNLIEAIKYSNRAFLFDNSSDKRVFICEIENANNVIMHTDKIPNWFNKYFMEKLK